LKKWAILAVVFAVVFLSFSLLAGEKLEWPDLAGQWALFQVVSDYWEAPLLGERPRRIYQIAKIAIAQDGPDLVLRSEGICLMKFDMGTSMVRLSVSPEFLKVAHIGPLRGSLSREGDEVLLKIPTFTVLNGVRLAEPETEPLPTSPEDPRVVDIDGDGKPGFTVYVRILGFIPGETYVVQRLRQEYHGRVWGPDLVRGVIAWEDEQVTLGASGSFFLISGRGRPDPDPNHSFFILRRITGTETCDELIGLFQEELEGQASFGMVNCL